MISKYQKGEFEKIVEININMQERFQKIQR